MEDVTDAAFRRLIANYSKKDAKKDDRNYVTFTEFTSADGLVLAPLKGRQSILRKLLYSDIERPIVAQLFSASPERMESAAAMAAELGFDGIDINMGCPDRAIEKGLCGSAMIRHPELAVQIIRACKRGAQKIPVSVKTRIGYSQNEIATWVPTLLNEGIANLTMHARTRNEMSLVPARWEHIKEVVDIRNRMAVTTTITGNGDVKDLIDARLKAEATGCDGVMLGRAIYGNPWLFLEKNNPEQGRGIASFVPTPKERIKALLEHITLFDELLGEVSNFTVMKKHFKAYISGWDNAKDLRVQLMETNSKDEAIAVLQNAILQA